MRKTVVVLAVLLLLAGGAATAAWRIADGTGNKEPAAAGEGGSFRSELDRTTGLDLEEASRGEPPDAGASGADAAADEDTTGEDFSYTSPDQRYVTETQRHQNFLRAVAEGRVLRLEATGADVRPVGDPNTSYIYFTLTADSGLSHGTMVFKFESGMWRIAAVNQLGGDLGGGTNYLVPASFEDDLAREIAELQPFFTKVAEGRFAYMEVHSVNHPGENETVLTGVVAGKGGRTVPAEMRLRRDYGIWHLTYITDPP